MFVTKNYPDLYSDVTVFELIHGITVDISTTRDGLGRWTEVNDFGFREWADAHAKEMMSHFQEQYQNHNVTMTGLWYGAGIGHGYGMEGHGLAIVDVNFRHVSEDDKALGEYGGVDVIAPPVYYRGVFHDRVVSNVLTEMQVFGSKVAPNSSPKGLVVSFAEGPEFKVELDGGLDNTACV